MAKTKKQVSKTPKKHSTKYSKLAAVCSKELTAKKTALVRAEKALAKAQKTHSELLSEVARLDMLDRSLKALINGTEPPQNVRYVYTYPQWVWYPYNGWYGCNPYTYTVTLGAQSGTQYQNFQGGQFTTTNAINTVTTPAISSNLSLTNCIPASGSLNINSDSSLIGYNSSGLSSSVLTSSGSSEGPTWQTFTTTTPTGSDPIETVDLSTGAVDPEATDSEKETAEVKAEDLVGVSEEK
jgi:hypothetical protein